MTPARRTAGVVVLVVLAAALILLRLLLGPDDTLRTTIAWPDAQVLPFRVSAIVCAVLVGAALGVSGVLLQALLRNPLASPFILGVSSGAGLGVMTAIYLGAVAGLPLAVGSNVVPATAGAIATLGIVYGLGRRRGWLDPLSLVLTGVVVSAMCGALIMMLQHLVPHGLRGDLVSWMMGHIPEAPDRTTLVIFAVITTAGLACAVAAGRAMDAATLADDEALSVGVDLARLRVLLFLVAGAMAAAAVALAGPIGFVGLIGPHAARLVVGPRHRVLAVAAALAGVILVVGAEVARQVIDLGGGRMPVGIFTALVGGPTFLWLLRTGKGQA